MNFQEESDEVLHFLSGIGFVTIVERAFFNRNPSFHNGPIIFTSHCCPPDPTLKWD